MKKLIEIGQAVFIVGLITGILPSLACGVLFKILGIQKGDKKLLKNFQNLIKKLKESNKKQVKYVIVCKASELLKKVEQKEKSIQQTNQANVQINN